MSDPIQKLTHVADGLARLLTQFKGQPNISGILASYLRQIQELETMLFSLMAERYVDTAIGAQLDGIGRVVGERRGGKNDVDYRVAIKGRIRANAGNGRVEDIHTLFVNLLAGFSFVFTAGPDAEFVYEIVEPLTPSDPSPTILNAQLQIAKGGGIRASLLYGTQPADEIFTYATGDALEADSMLGYADDGQTLGGYYRDVV